MDELELVRLFRRGDVKLNPVARAAARDRLQSHIADGRRAKRNNFFVCYRREDSSAYAGWLTAELGRQFGKQRVFRGVDSGGGVDVRDQVGEVIDSCAVLLAVIGPRWLMVQDESGRRRIDHPDDLVALEIAAALKRDIRVIPVLVAGARMPREADLPVLLAGLAYRTAIELSDAGWERQVTGLLDDLKEVFESTAGTNAYGALPVVRAAATAVLQNQPDERGRRVACATPLVIGDASGPGRTRLLNALVPELQCAAASIQREAKFALRLGLAVLRLQLVDRPTGLVRDDWLNRSSRER
jgi:TIR domain